MKKLKQPNVYSYKCSVYPVNLDVIFDAHQADYLNSKYYWSQDPEATFVYEDDNAYGATYDLVATKDTNIRTVLVVFDGIPNAPQMSHEAFHVMNGIFKEVGLEFNTSTRASNEHLAYLIEWAVECMCIAADKEKKCKKKKK
jgi:hypothetical protein